jgi:hypothetical protein
MSKWIDKEKGPECFCGMPTGVYVNSDGEAGLLCIFHDTEAGAIFPLPKDARPDNWPDIPREELNALMKLGSEQADAEETED